MPDSTVFMNNRSQAVRLPKAVALPESVKRVSVIALGKSRLITPADSAWDSWFDSAMVTDDFMEQREQPETQEREAL